MYVYVCQYQRTASVLPPMTLTPFKSFGDKLPHWPGSHQLGQTRHSESTTDLLISAFSVLGLLVQRPVFIIILTWVHNIELNSSYFQGKTLSTKLPVKSSLPFCFLKISSVLGLVSDCWSNFLYVQQQKQRVFWLSQCLCKVIKSVEMSNQKSLRRRKKP